MSSHAAGSTCRPLGVVRPRRRPRRFAGTESPAAASGATTSPGLEGRPPAIRFVPRPAPRGRAAGGGSQEPSSCGAGPTSPSCILRGGGRETAGGAPPRQLRPKPSPEPAAGSGRAAGRWANRLADRPSGHPTDQPTDRPAANLPPRSPRCNDRGGVGHRSPPRSTALAPAPRRDAMVIESGEAASRPRTNSMPKGAPRPSPCPSISAASTSGERSPTA